jgi:hypothetical protein
MVGLHDLALLGKKGRTLGGIAEIIDKDAQQQAVRLAFADMKCEAALDVGETARLNDIGDEVGAHLGCPAPQLADAPRRDIGSNRSDQD